jgi:subtilisin family serine protease
MNCSLGNAWYFGMVLSLFLLILVPMNVFAQENSTEETIPAQDPLVNGTASITVNEIVINAPFAEVKPQGPVYDNEPVFITDPDTGERYVKDRLIVRFKTDNTATSSVSQEKLSMAHAKVGARIKNDLSAGPAGVPGLQVVQLPSGTDVKSAIKEYESNPDVLYAEPDYEVSILPVQTEPILADADTASISSVPTDEFFSYLWGLHNTGQDGGTADADIDAPEAWDISTGSNSVVVAVIDTGVLYTHNDLSSNIWSNTNETINGIDDDVNGYIDDVRGWDFVNSDNNPTDDNSHGTHCAGTIGAIGNNGIGVSGVNWHVKIMPVKVLAAGGSSPWSNITQGVIYAGNNGAQIISMSLSGTGYNQGLADAILASPALVVCAAGNDENNNDVTPYYPASYPSANIIAVSATNSTDDLVTVSTVSSWGSNYGATKVDLAAPGQNILSTYNVSGYYQFKGGTSMATPHVSGVAALIKSINPQLTNTEIKNIILNSVDVIPSLSGKVLTSGRLNANKAVLAAQAPQTKPVANFSGTPTTGTAPLTVTFTDRSTNGPTAWNWSFGDGTFSSTKNPTHVYTSSGMHTVSLNASNSAGSNTFTRSGYINVITVTNGTDTIGVYRNGRYYLRNSNTGGVSDTTFIFGQAGDIPVTGDWNGDGTDTVGVYRNGRYYLRNSNTGGYSDMSFVFGQAGDVPVAGDWNGI